MGQKINKNDGITIEEHERKWDEILAGISGAVDIIAIQDVHVDFYELLTYQEIKKN